MSNTNKKRSAEIQKHRVEDGLTKGSRVTVKAVKGEFNGVIISEGKRGTWWNVLKDGTKYPASYMKKYCRPEIKKAEDWSVEFSDLAKEQMEADPKLPEMVRDISARIRQAIHDFQAGKYASMDEAMLAIGARPIELDDDDDD